MMEGILIEQLATIFEVYIIIEFLSKFLECKYEGIMKYIGFVLGFSAIIVSNILITNIVVFEGLAGLIYIAICVIYSLIFLKGTIFEKIFASCIDILIILLVGMSSLAIIAFIANISVLELITYRGVARVLVLILSKSVLFLVTRLVLTIKQKNKLELLKIEWIAILLIFISSFFIGIFIFEISANAPTSKANDLRSIRSILGLIIINVISYFIFIKTSIKNKERERYNLMELQLSEQTKNMIEIKKSYQEIRKIRHDLNNYISCATTLIQEEKYDAAMEYLLEISEHKLENISRLVLTDSDILNAIINAKISLCRSNNINIDYKITGATDKISDIDLSILMGNLLDNAIEACIKDSMEKPMIELYITNNKNYLNIILSNTISYSILANNPKLVTSKKNKLNHGLGMLTIKDIVEKHNGMINIFEENSKFISDIWLRFD